MLVLSRRVDESIVVDRKITIQVVKIQGNKVRLAIDAPPDVSVDREEVRRRRDAEMPTVRAAGGRVAVHEERTAPLAP